MVHRTPYPCLYDKLFEISTNMFSNKTVFLSPFKFMSSYIFIFQQCILLTYLIHFKLNCLFFFLYAQILFCYMGKIMNLGNTFVTIEFPKFLVAIFRPNKCFFRPKYFSAENFHVKFNIYFQTYLMYFKL
jgi:hypothetical protein